MCGLRGWCVCVDRGGGRSFKSTHDACMQLPSGLVVHIEGHNAMAFVTHLRASLAYPCMYVHVDMHVGGWAITCTSI